MPVSVVRLGTPAVTSANNLANVAYTTETLTPVPGRTWIVAVARSFASGNAAEVTVTGMNLTWTNVVTRLGGSSSLHIVKGTGTPVAGAISATFSTASTGCGITVYELDGADTSDPVVGTNTRTTGSTSVGATITLPAAANANSGGVIAMVNKTNTEAINPEAGWTELDDYSWTTPTVNAQVQWIPTFDGTPSWTWVTSTAWNAVAVELRAASGGMGQPVSIAAPAATASGGALAPVVDAGVNLQAPAAAASGAAPAPVAGAAVGVAAPTAAATAAAPAPQVTAASSVAVNALAPAATATASAPSPSVRAGVGVLASTAGASAAAPAPQVVAGTNIPANAAAPAGGCTAQAPTPTFSAGVNLTVPLATAVAESRPPLVGAGVNISLPTATAAARAFAPFVSTGSTAPVYITKWRHRYRMRR